MAMSKGANTYNRQNWEESMKEKHGKDFKTCNQPFTVFRWCPGARMRFKKTEVCQICSLMKNICQTCLLDLEYYELGPVPVSVVDQTHGNRYIGGTRNEEDMEIDELSNVLDELPSNQTSTQLPIQVRYNILGSLCPSGTDYTHGSLCVSGTTYTPGTVE